eukprot:UN4082
MEMINLLQTTFLNPSIVSAMFQIIYAGLFWFVLPTCLVICNDIMAYYCGQLLGKKLFKRKFLELSPNKTWEGFLGSAICTLVFAFWISGKLCAHQFMTCVPEDITFSFSALSCKPAPMYGPRRLSVILEDFPPLHARELLDLCLKFSPAVMGAVLNVEVCSAQIHALCLGLFAS